MQRQLSPTLVAVCCLLAVTVAVPAPVVAQDNSTAADVLEDVSTIADENASVGLDTAQAAVSGALARISDVWAGISSETTASEACDDLQSTFNANNGSIQSYVNNRTNASTAADVLELTCDVDDETATVFLQADVNGSDYENATVVDSTDRSVDEDCTLEEAAARNADDELDHVVAEFVDPNADVSQDYRRKLITRYAGKVDCSFLG